MATGTDLWVAHFVAKNNKQSNIKLLVLSWCFISIDKHWRDDWQLGLWLCTLRSIGVYQHGPCVTPPTKPWAGLFCFTRMVLPLQFLHTLCMPAMSLFLLLKILLLSKNSKGRSLASCFHDMEEHWGEIGMLLLPTFPAFFSGCSSARSFLSCTS